MALTLDYTKRYTYADYLTWADDKMRELFNGLVKLMSPAPAVIHQRASIRLGNALFKVVKRNKGKCEVFCAPFDVRLPKNNETADDQIYTVVQPDICVICDLSKLDERGCLGAPDMIIEIQSVSTAKYDLNDKFKIYEEAGVREYWVVFPYEKGILQFILQDDGKYDQGAKYDIEKIPVHIFYGAEIDLNDVFE
ncbi:MAG: Uma2 family endonuclease [Candidatus Symbiothrix sp.]|jgi:Uma2 family endonuclease|nr:Uma2 family endonuclease [Candidatus Symbiothrix sp.]